MQRTYIAIDLKSYYASVECMERGLDPMTTNLVVADLSRTEKTICLAVSPSLKAYGIPGRARLFEVVERVKEVNAERQRKAGGNLFEKSCDARELAADPLRAVGYHRTAGAALCHVAVKSAKLYKPCKAISGYISSYHSAAHAQRRERCGDRSKSARRADGAMRGAFPSCFV